MPEGPLKNWAEALKKSEIKTCPVCDNPIITYKAKTCDNCGFCLGCG